MTIPAWKRVLFVALALGLVSAASAARAPADSNDLIHYLDPLWGKSAADFPKAAKLKASEYTLSDSPIPGSDKKVLLPSNAAKARWTPTSLAGHILSFEFDAKLGLSEVSGFLKGTAADFDALMKEMNTRYGQYATHSSAMDTHVYGWVFPKATLSISSNAGEPLVFRIQANP
jgi:hypothetical protein